MEGMYLTLRRIFFWLFFVLFIFISPLLLFYSLGYKFDVHSKKFLKTGALSIKTFPKEAEVFLDKERYKKLTPCVIKELFPKKYHLLLKKKNFYPYSITVQIKPGEVKYLDIVLVPKIKGLKKIKFDFDVYKFFVVRHLFKNNILLFTDQGIYLLDDDFKNIKKLVSFSDKDIVSTIKGLKEFNGFILFWNKNNIWKLNFNRQKSSLEIVYKAEEKISDVFFGWRGKYLIIQDGLNVLAEDIGTKVSFSILKLKSLNSEIFYDKHSDILYIKDKIPQTKKFSLFKVKLASFLNEGKKN